MYNPFENGIEAGADDGALIREALGGSRASLERLIRRHQPWIYNISCRMVCDLDEAEDITQEILIKLITRLSSYDPDKGSFRTWLYRIVANHVISLSKARREEPLSAFAGERDYFKAIGSIVDHRQSAAPENRVLADESRIACLTGMLLCLDRRSRIVFILGEVFGVSDAAGSEIMSVSRANFRKILSRSREKVYGFLEQKCGLVSEDNPCRCARAANVQIRMGFINPDRLLTGRGSIRVSEALGARIRKIESKYSYKLRELYRDGPFLDSPDLTEWIRTVLDSGEFRDAFNLS